MMRNVALLVIQFMINLMYTKFWYILSYITLLAFKLLNNVNGYIFIVCPIHRVIQLVDQQPRLQGR
jgi:hypothetical protein